MDVDVPLFLPLSGQRRLADLRYTAQQEQQHGFRISGQVNFESGWEFGFYLSNAVTARAIWNPRTEVQQLYECSFNIHRSYESVLITNAILLAHYPCADQGRLAGLQRSPDAPAGCVRPLLRHPEHPHSEAGPGQRGLFPSILPYCSCDNCVYVIIKYRPRRR